MANRHWTEEISFHEGHRLTVTTSPQWVFLCWEPFVTGEQLWLDRDSNPGTFADRANTLPLSYRDTRSYHRQLFTLTLPTYKNMDFWLTDDNIATHGHNFEGSDFTHWAFFNGHILLSKHFGKTPTELSYCLYLK